MNELEQEFSKAVLPNKSRGLKRVDDRRVINGIYYVLLTCIHGAVSQAKTAPSPLSCHRCAMHCRATDALGNLVWFILLSGNRYDTVGVAPLIKRLNFGASF